MMPNDLEHAQEIVLLLYEILEEEGMEVSLVNPNPDFIGSATNVVVRHDFMKETRYEGETVLECLQKAIVDSRKRKAPPEAGKCSNGRTEGMMPNALENAQEIVQLLTPSEAVAAERERMKKRRMPN